MYRINGKGAPLLAIGLLSLLAGLGVAFETGNTYTYIFQGSVKTRFSENLHYSRYTFQSPLLVQRSADQELVLQLSSPQLAIHKEVYDDEDSEKPKAKAQPMANSASLEKPFRVYFEEGVIKAFDTYKEEPKWVANFKRGIIGFFQLNLTDNSGSSFEAPAGRVYRHVDDCEYLVRVADTRDRAGNFNVTKTRHEGSCRSKYIQRHMPIDVHECPRGEKDPKRNSSLLVIDLELSGPRANPVIKRAWLTEWSSYTPFGLPLGSYTTETKFEMKLRNKNSAVALAPSEGARANDKLHYEPPEVHNFYANTSLREAHFLSNILRTSSSVDQVMNLLEAFVREKHDYQAAMRASLDHSSKSNSIRREDLRGELGKSRIGTLFMKLHLLMGTLNYENIEQVHGGALKQGEDYEKAFWDLVSVVGTNPSIAFMRKLMEKDKVPEERIRDFLWQVSLHIKAPSQKLFDEYLAICQVAKVQADKTTKRTCLLTLASLIHQHCIKPHAKSLRAQYSASGDGSGPAEVDTTVCQPTTADEYFSRLVAPVASTSSSGAGQEAAPSEKMFNAKLAAELATKFSVQYLLEIVKDQSAHPAVRAAALTGLVKAASMFPLLVKSPAISVFHDDRQRTQHRIAAFEILHAAGMSDAELMSMVNKMSHETNHQLVDYVQSHVKNLASTSELPCSGSPRKIPKTTLARLGQTLSRRSLPTLRRSQLHLLSSKKDGSDYGLVDSNLLAYEDDSQLLPAQWRFRRSEIISGLKVERLKVSLRLHRLNRTISRLADMYQENSNILDLFSHDKTVWGKALAIFGKTSTVREEVENAYASLYVSLYGRPFLFKDYEWQDIKKMLADDGTIKMSHIDKLISSINNQEYLSTRINMETLELYNNAMGLPLIHMSSDFEFRSHKIDRVALSVKPGFFKDERQGKPLSDISLAINSKHGQHRELFSWTGAILMHSKQFVGVGLYKKEIVGVPVDLTLHANMTNRQAELQVQPVQENFYHVQRIPVTFVNSFDTSLSDAQRLKASSWHPFNPANATVSFHASPESFDLKPIVRQQQFVQSTFGYKLEGHYDMDQNDSRVLSDPLGDWLDPVGAAHMFHRTPATYALSIRLSSMTTLPADGKENNLTIAFNWRLPNQSARSEPKTNAERELELLYPEQTAPGNYKTGIGRMSIANGPAKQHLASAKLTYFKEPDNEKLDKMNLNYRFNQSAEAQAYCLTGSPEQALQSVHDTLHAGESLAAELDKC